MLGFEMKKLIIKQYGLIIIIAVCIIKLLSTSDLFHQEYSGLRNAEQTDIYTEYLNELGGILTDEKENKILALYTELIGAVSMQEDCDRKLQSGEYSTLEDYYADTALIPDIIKDKEPIQKLFSSYEIVSEDREKRAVIGLDAPALQTGTEYVLVFILCYISAAAFYYERKMSKLQTAAPNCIKANGARVFALFLEILLIWGIFALIEILALISEIGTSNLFYSVVSLESFRYSNYSELNILQVFIAIHMIKLIGYLLICALSSFTAKITHNFPLSIFVPISMVIVWQYLFNTGDIAFYNPLSLMRGAPYFIGGDNINFTFGAVPREVLTALIIISLSVIALSVLCLIFSGKNKAKKLMKKTVLVITAFMLCGCSANTAVLEDIVIAADESLAYSNGCYFTCEFDTAETDGFYEVIGSRLVMRDERLNVIEEKLNRDLFNKEEIISLICANKHYLYYSTDFGSDMICRLYRINLSDFTEEMLIEFDASDISTGTTKYLDLIRDYPAEYLDRYDFWIDNFFIAGNQAILLMKSGKVYNLDLNTKINSYLFEDINIRDICSAAGRIFFIDRRGILTLFDNEKAAVSKRIFTDLCADNGYIYACNSDGVFRYDAQNLEEAKITDIGCNDISVKNGRIFLESGRDNYYIDEQGENKIFFPDNCYFTALTDDGKIIVVNETEITLYENIKKQ